MLASAFGLALILPLASIVVPPREVEIPVSAWAPTFFLNHSTPPVDVVTPVMPPATTRTSATHAFAMPHVSTVVRGAWVLGALASLMPFLLGLWKLRRLRRQARMWDRGREIASTLRHAAGVSRRVQVMLHRDLVAPVTCGVVRPAIGLPVEAQDWTAREIRHALLHELEHVRRCDWPVQLVARATCALYWFNPLVWVAWRQLCLETERACDDAVLRDADNTDYAEQLVSLARRLRAGTPSPLLSMAGRSTLTTRVSAILNRNVARGPVGVISAAVSLAATLLLAFTLSPLRPIVAATQSSTGAGASGRAGNAPAFDVVSIKINRSGPASNGGERSGLRFEPGGRLAAVNISLRELVLAAYRDDISRSQLIGGPDWIASERYDISARADEFPPGQIDVSRANMMVQMLRHLLADRFKLRTHFETRDGPTFALIVAAGGSKLKPAKPMDCTVVTTDPARSCHQFNRVGRTGMDGHSVDADDIAAALQMYLGTPVTNKTGLSGLFDVLVRWNPDDGQTGGNPPRVDAGEPQPNSGDAGVFTSIQEQLGLRLQSVRAPRNVLVIDSAEQPDTGDALQSSPAATSQPPTPLAIKPAAFEVQSIRRNTSGAIGGRQQFTDGRFAATNTSVRLLIQDAYRVQSFQLVGGPDWLDTARFDIVATIAPNTAADQRPLMLRTLLAERFNLRVHTERREMPTYALIVDRDDRRLGPDLRPSDVECKAISEGGSQRAPATNILADGRPECGMTMSPAGIRAGGMTMRQLANALAQYVQRTVIDKTGLMGFYDFDLRYSPRGPGISAEAAATDTRPSIFTAVQEQLGLKLQAERDLVDVLVIDRLEPPTEN